MIVLWLPSTRTIRQSFPGRDREYESNADIAEDSEEYVPWSAHRDPSRNSSLYVVEAKSEPAKGFSV